MYVIRSALRASPGRPPARVIRGRRYPAIPRLRSFHTTRQLAQAADPPPPPNSTPIDENGANAADNEKPTAAEQADAAIATNDPEALAQKLQRLRQSSRRTSAALRRQQRGKKAEGLPPVIVPDWFLQKRVVRHEDQLRDQRQASGRPVLSVAVNHVESGQNATCTIPAGAEFDAADVLSRLVRGLWSRRLDDDEKHRVEKYLQDNISPSDRSEPGHLQVQGQELLVRLAASLMAMHEDVSMPPSAASVADMKIKRESAAKLEALVQRLRDPNVSAQDLREAEEVLATQDSQARANKAARKRNIAKTRQMGASRRISPLVVAEIRSTIAACLSAIHISLTETFPAAKTNVVLHSPSSEQEKYIDQIVLDTALGLGADLITLHAQDLALLGGDYLGEGSEPSPRSIRSLGYETYRLNADLSNAFEEVDEVADEEPDVNLPPSGDNSGWPPGRQRAFAIPISVLKAAMTGGFNKSAPFGISGPFEVPPAMMHEAGKSQSQSDYQLEDLKLATLLETLVDADGLKQQRRLVGTGEASSSDKSDQFHKSSKTPAFFDYSMNAKGVELELNSTLPANAKPDITLAVKASTIGTGNAPEGKSKIIYVKDFKELNATHYGGRIIRKLEELVRKRRFLGERIMIVGSTCSRELTPELNAGGVRGLQGEGESSFFRTIVVAAETHNNEMSLEMSLAAAKLSPGASDASFAEKSKFRRINLLHIRHMLSSLHPILPVRISSLDLMPLKFRPWAPIFSSSSFNRVLTYDEVHRIALTTIGLHLTAQDDNFQLNWGHVALAIGLLKASDMTKYMYFDRVRDASKAQNAVTADETQANTKSPAVKQLGEKSLQRQRELGRISATATKHEKRLMPGIADPDQIKTTFEQVHVPKETVDSIRTITSLSLLRPEAFSYGILATEKISGALLYGPPGTGKTLLAKAVAKESGSTVLEVSGSQIMDKYVGEGEKNVAAIFSLARKLSPCIVFLDEADAVFASRDAMRERTSHRDILNQFLKEWDGLNDLSVFVMVATNRPFDLDDAVIRRLPRRLLVDLPTQVDRREILRIHLKGEQLDDSVDLEDLAKRTPFYSGSDLKNVAVSAALACVKEENEQAATAVAKATLDTEPVHEIDPGKSGDSSTTSSSSTGSSSSSHGPPHLVRGQTYSFPEKRILHVRHFDKALQEISASISEDMSSLSAIKKFDEQYGDRKGNKRKKDFGFGVLTERNENAARVRT